MVVDATNVFVSHIKEMLNCNIPDGFELIKESQSSGLCETLKQFDRRHGFQHSEVLKLELEGNNYITRTMDLLWRAISKRKDERDAYERYAYGSISENYRRVYEESEGEPYDKQRLLCDAVSGMTEQYLIRVYNELKDLSDDPRSIECS